MTSDPPELLRKQAELDAAIHMVNRLQLFESQKLIGLVYQSIEDESMLNSPMMVITQLHNLGKEMPDATILF